MAQRRAGVVRGPAVTLLVDGVPVNAHGGETVATALLANGVTAFHRGPEGRARGPFCNMGVCFECLVQVEAGGWVRACVTPVREGMSITTGLCFAERKLVDDSRP